MKNLFLKYQKPLLKLANNRFGRVLLGIDTKEKIAGITDNAFAVRDGNKLKAEFRCYPVYAKRIGFALSQLDIARDIYKGLTDYKGLLNYCGLLNSREFPTVMALEATKYSGAGDGQVYRNVSEGWNTCHDATTGTTSISGIVATYADVNGNISRCFYPIDLSAIGGGSKSSVATFTLTCVTNASSNDNNPSWALVQGFQAATNTLEAADYIDCGDAIDNPTEGTDARVPYSDLDAANETGTWTLNATGRGWIDSAFGGWLKLGVRSSFDVDDQEPGGLNRFFFGLSDQDGTTKDPTLVITYTPASGFLVFM